MSRRNDKWGTSYDPRNNGGKLERPQTEQQPELYGCGNPDCPDCNPHTMGKGLGFMSNPEFFRGGGGGSGATMEEIRRAMSGMSDDITRRILYGTFEFGAEPSKGEDSKPKGPPQSYKDAREKVKDWIITAPTQSFEDIVGNEEALGQLRDAVEAPVKYKDLYEAYGMKMPKGALLSGPPGCGKTMFARATASEMKKLYGKDTELVSVSGAELQSPFVGVTEGYIKGIFTYAREYKAFHGHPLLVFIDEADAILPDRTGRIRPVTRWEESQVATFLAEMDGMQESGAFVLLATNRPEVIDQAVLRDGRCDFKINVLRPTVEALEAILRKNFAGVLIHEEDTIESLVFAAVEAFQDPHKVLIEAHILFADMEKEELVGHKHKHFLFSHIVSGAMAASVPARAKLRAFARDKLYGVAKGVQVADVVNSVSALFKENKVLNHDFALNEFKEKFWEEAQAEMRKEQVSKNKGLN